MNKILDLNPNQQKLVKDVYDPFRGFFWQSS